MCSFARIPGARVFGAPKKDFSLILSTACRKPKNQVNKWGDKSLVELAKPALAAFLES
jgi:hypothetical protein